MTLFIDRLITSYYCEKMETDLTDITPTAYIKCKESYFEGGEWFTSTDKDKTTIRVLFNKLFESKYFCRIGRS